MATQKITMGRNKDTDYESKNRAALAQAETDFGVSNMKNVADYGQCPNVV